MQMMISNKFPRTQANAYIQRTEYERNFHSIAFHWTFNLLALVLGVCKYTNPRSYFGVIVKSDDDIKRR